MSLRTAATETKRKSKSNIVCLCGLQWLCLLSVGDLKVNVSKGRMSLWISMIVFVKCRRSESKCFCWSYVFADCNGCVLLRTQEKIEKQYCMSLRTAMIVFVKCRRSESTCFCRSYVFADCNGCVFLRTQEKIEKQYCMSLRTAMIVFVKCRRSESTCFVRSYVFADCGYGDKEKI